MPNLLMVYILMQAKDIIQYILFLCLLHSFFISYIMYPRRRPLPMRGPAPVWCLQRWRRLPLRSEDAPAVSQPDTSLLANHANRLTWLVCSLLMLNHYLLAGPSVINFVCSDLQGKLTIIDAQQFKENRKKHIFYIFQSILLNSLKLQLFLTFTSIAG